eukprot:COSAG01_NODE_35159_length_536_cov_0.695652_1_plen_101_part_10
MRPVLCCAAQPRNTTGEEPFELTPQQVWACFATFMMRRARTSNCQQSHSARRLNCHLCIGCQVMQVQMTAQMMGRMIQSATGLAFSQMQVPLLPPPPSLFP